MATYAELYSEFQSDAALRNAVAVACCKKAQLLIDSASPTAAQMTWASNVLLSPANAAAKLLPYVLAANSSSTLGQIQSASDAIIQTNINAAADKLIAAGIA